MSVNKEIFAFDSGFNMQGWDGASNCGSRRAGTRVLGFRWDSGVKWEEGSGSIATFWGWKDE